MLLAISWPILLLVTAPIIACICWTVLTLSARACRVLIRTSIGFTNRLTVMQFFIYIIQGTYAAFISKAGDFDEAGVWQVYLSENGVPLSGRGYFSVVNA